jgi:hypothetical protein
MNLTSVPAPLKAGLTRAGLLLATWAGLAAPLPGDLDPGFQLDPSLPPASETLAAAAHPDGRLLTVFQFSTGPELVALKGTARWIRLSSAGRCRASLSGS